MAKSDDLPPQTFKQAMTAQVKTKMNYGTRTQEHNALYILNPSSTGEVINTQGKA